MRDENKLSKIWNTKKPVSEKDGSKKGWMSR